ncbi:MBL fold hydrolase [Ktedonospora formicarum]|uniref:MBL fold hydrolase n=2 Tax=Ktedonospora formicarum TaxID=2778364 RepID=A0A8J3I0H9_9CHLR|nr:MBL fold hydrolase [Ktedonospora formicarum]
MVHTITDRFSMANTYLIEDERLVVVDPGSDLNVRLLHNYIRQFLGRSPQDIDLVVLTHLHTNHTPGVMALKAFCSAPVAASALARRAAPKIEAKGGMLPRISHFAGRMLPDAFQYLEVFSSTYAEQMRLVDLWLEDVNGLPEHPDWRIIASPGYTPGSLCLYNPFSQELICGDTFITSEGEVPHLHAGARRYLFRETLHLLRSLDVRYLYPGHGRPILARSPLQRYGVEW